MNVQNKMNSVRITRELWLLARADIEAGKSLGDVAASHGVNVPALRNWAHRDGYSAKTRKFDLSRDKSGVSGRKKAKVLQPSKIVHVPQAPVFPLSAFVPPPVSPEAGAVEFSAALVPHIQALVAAGLQSIEPPRNIAELKTLVELGRKLAGLDAKQSSGKVQLFSPLRDVSRRGGASQVVVDCENTVQTVDCGDSIQDFEV
jgi:hypothetical protein